MIRTQVGIKIFGNDLKPLETVSRQVAGSVKKIRGPADVYPGSIGGSPYIDIKTDRQAAARYGIDELPPLRESLIIEYFAFHKCYPSDVLIGRRELCLI